MNISIVATLRSEIWRQLKSSVLGTSQPKHSEFSVWINCEGVNLMKNKGRVYTHIPAGTKWQRFSVTLDKGDLHTALLPQMQQKRSQPYSLGLQLLPQCSCQPTLSSCSSILHSICAWDVALTGVCRNCCCCFGGLAWTILTRSTTAALKRELYSTKELKRFLRHNPPSTCASGQAPAALEAPEHWAKVAFGHIYHCITQLQGAKRDKR